MDRIKTTRPQVPGDSGSSAGGDGHRHDARVRGAKNLRVGSSNRSTTMAHNIKDTDFLNIMTYNVRTLMKDERLIELENALTDVKWDILGLAEVRRQGEQIEERDKNIFYYYGETSGLHGIGFLVSKKWKENIIEFIGYSERIAVLRFLVTPKTTLTIIQTYAPTSAYSDEEIEDFYDLLNRACDENRGTWNIVLGDFNAKIGKRQTTDSTNILGSYGLGNRNERGSRLIQFAFGQSMKVANSFFMKKPKRRWTWVSPNGDTKNEIDFVLTSDMQIVNDISCLNKIKYSSDHRPIRAKIKFNFKIHRMKRFSKIINHSRNTLLKQSDTFNLELQNSFKDLKIKETDDTDHQYATIVTEIQKSMKKIKPTKRNKAKLSADTHKLIEIRQTFQITSPEYNTIDRKVKRSIRRDIRKINCDVVKTAIERNTSLRIAKQGITKGRQWINSLRDGQGIKHNSREKIMTICTDFYKEMYSDASRNEINTKYICSDTIPFITGQEVHHALKALKYGKSPGRDGVTTEALKIGSQTLIPHLTTLFNSILKTGQIPKQFCHSNIVLLHKKGDLSNINNYRPISLISHIYKIFIKIIQNRIASKLDKYQPPEQAGFRPHFSTTDHLHTVNQIIEKFTEFHKPLYLAFVDYSKAFDSLKHSAIFSALEAQDIDKTYIDLLRIIYSHSTADIKLHSCGPTFKINKGVKQGDPLSPVLFTSTLEEIFKTLSDLWSAKGIKIDGTNITNLRFADDIVLFATSATEIEKMLQDLSTASLETGLLMNRSKTKLMTNSIKRKVEIDAAVIHYVDEYIYLGQLVSFENRHDKEIDRRVDNAWKSFWSMKTLMKGDLPITLKRKLIDMCILPILTYGAQTWSLTEAQKSRLKICQRAMERSILGVHRIDHISNTALRSMTGIADVGKKSARLKWDWAGHISRMHPARWAKISTLWVPNDRRRRRGRPRKRWRDDLDAFDGNWLELAKDRDNWKDLGETFAQQWDTIG